MLYHSIVSSPYFRTTPIMLLLNKADLLRKKCRSGVPSQMIDRWYPEFTGDPGDWKAVFRFIERMFLSQSNAHTDPDPDPTKTKSKAPPPTREKRVYSHMCTAVDQNDMRAVLGRVTEIVLSNNLKATVRGTGRMTCMKTPFLFFFGHDNSRVSDRAWSVEGKNVPVEKDKSPFKLTFPTLRSRRAALPLGAPSCVRWTWAVTDISSNSSLSTTSPLHHNCAILPPYRASSVERTYVRTSQRRSGRTSPGGPLAYESAAESHARVAWPGLA